MRNLKLKLSVAAVALAMTGVANAAIDRYNPGVASENGNGELFFSVYSPNAPTPTSFYFDLRPIVSADPLLGGTMGTFRLNDFLPTGAVAGGTGTGAPGPFTNGPGFVDQLGIEFRWVIDASTPGWSTFVQNAGGNTADWRWNVAGGDSTGSQGVAHQVRYVSTRQPGPAGTITAGQLNNMKATDSYVATVNAFATQPDDSGAFISGTEAYFGTGFQENWFSTVPWNSTGALSAVLPFTYITGGGANATQSLFQGTWSFRPNAAGPGFELIYATAPIPEPSEWALMALGLAVAGFIANRRRRMV